MAHNLFKCRLLELFFHTGQQWSGAFAISMSEQGPLPDGSSSCDRLFGSEGNTDEINIRSQHFPGPRNGGRKRRHLELAGSGQVKPATVIKKQSNAGSPGQKNLLQFLENPLDLIQFKKAKGISNNGAAQRPSGARTYHKPPERGFYYEYFNFPIFGKDKRGDTPPREALGDLVVVVYKFGQTVGDFYDTREVLIEISVKARDCDLMQTNLVGQDLKVITDRFGTDYIKKEDLTIFHANRQVLVLSAPDGMIQWFRYARLNFDIGSASDVPEWLMKY